MIFCKMALFNLVLFIPLASLPHDPFSRSMHIITIPNHFLSVILFSSLMTFARVGKLIEVEDNMNIQLKDITFTARDGRVSHLDQVYIRGSQVRYFIVPDMLKHAPMFKNIATGAKGKGIGLGRGKATV